MPDPSGNPSGLFAGRYAIDRVLGEGASAVVHRARDTRDGTIVAIKILREELAESSANARFLKEIRRTSGLQHPNIVPVLASGEEQGRPYFVLPYMEGGTLRLRLKRENQLDISEALSIARRVAEALDYAHERGLVHRDVKPENILFSGGQACLADFGIAHAFHSVYGETTSSNVPRGTPAYMSPEQATGGDRLDGRSDQFSLACVIYEMIAGMAAFVGPTPQSVVAQRLVHAPRGIRVYRPTVSVPFEEALSKAFALLPADRYSSCTSFIDTLAARHGAASPPLPTKPTARSRRLMYPIGAFAVLGVALLGYTTLPAARSIRAFDRDLDTTRVAVLPFVGSPGGSPADFLQEGLIRYRGLTVVESFAAADAVRQRGPIESLGDAFAVAERLGAGRVVVGRVSVLGSDTFAYAALYDVRERRELYHARVPIRDSLSALVSYAALADSLVLRGAAETSAGVPPFGSKLLPALQAVVRGRAALSEWNLVQAESLFAEAAARDPTYARAQLWLAQVRSWQDMPRLQWEGNAKRALLDTTSLTTMERHQAVGLDALARQDFSRACAAYRRIIGMAPADFIGWYGLGDCHRLDRVVIRDSATPSGWRFRSSYYHGMQSYQRAFELLPSSYRQFQRGAYERLQLLLFTTGTHLRSGVTADSSQRFLARPVADGDTLVFVPFPPASIRSGRLDGATLERSRMMTRGMFRRVALRWAAALPMQAGTKEAVAVSLEMIGDAAAARDTFRLARQLAKEPHERARLAAAEFVAHVKAALLDQSSDLAGAVDSAHWLFDLPIHDPRLSRESVARVALLTGRCRHAELLLRASVRREETPVVIPPTLLADVYGKVPLVAAGCLAPTAIPLVADELRIVGASEDDRFMSEYVLAGAVLALNFDSYPERIARLARLTDDYILVAEASLLRADSANARRILARQLERRREAGASGPLPDAGLTEARIWLALGDTGQAIATLDGTVEAFARAHPFDSRFVVQNAVITAALVKSLVLRADIAAARGMSARRWSNAVTTLWRSADAVHMPTFRRMQAYARQSH